MEASRRVIRGLIAWNAVLSAGAIGLVIVWTRPHAARFTELSVERIDVTDANGTRRMVIANRNRFPDLVIDGKVTKRTILPAGIVVYDEQGNDAGGYGTSAMRDDRGGPMARSMMLIRIIHHQHRLGAIRGMALHDPDRLRARRPLQRRNAQQNARVPREFQEAGDVALTSHGREARTAPASPTRPRGATRRSHRRR